jgi:FKBP-type peptidyl-prolyl cis-trans isomerase FkpA
MARKRDRIVALSIAILFFVFAFSSSFWVIWQLYKDNKEAKRVNNNQASSQDTSNTNTPAKTTTKLKGSQLSNFTPVSDSSVTDLQKIDTQAGTGAEVKPGDTVTVDYTGALAATGIVFESSLDTGQPVPLSLNQVIDGWKQGIPGMKVGGQRRLIIPANMAYGASPRAGSGIPPNAALVFDITLHSVGQ